MNGVNDLWTMANKFSSLVEKSSITWEELIKSTEIQFIPLDCEEITIDDCKKENCIAFYCSTIEKKRSALCKCLLEACQELHIIVHLKDEKSYYLFDNKKIKGLVYATCFEELIYLLGGEKQENNQIPYNEEI